MRVDHLSIELLSAHADRETLPEEAARVETHLADCARCRETLSSFREMKTRFSRAPRRPMPRDLRAGLEARLNQATRRDRRGAALRRPLLWVPLSLLVAAATAVFLLWNPAPAPVAPSSVPLDALLASHAQYQGESLAPHADLHLAYYSAQMAEKFPHE